MIAISQATVCEGEAIAILIEKGLLDHLAGTLKFQGSNCAGFVRKALLSISNIASDSPENIEKLIVSEAFKLCIEIASQSNEMDIRLNAMYSINNFICFGPTNLVLDVERGNPMVLTALIQALTTISNNTAMLKR